MSKQLTEEKVRTIVQEIVSEAIEAVLAGMDRMFQQERKERREELERLENKIDYNQKLNNKQFDEIKAELSNTVSKTEFNAAKKSFQN